MRVNPADTEKAIILANVRAAKKKRLQDEATALPRAGVTLPGHMADLSLDTPNLSVSLVCRVAAPGTLPGAPLEVRRFSWAFAN